MMQHDMHTIEIHARPAPHHLIHGRELRLPRDAARIARNGARSCDVTPATQQRQHKGEAE